MVILDKIGAVGFCFEERWHSKLRGLVPSSRLLFFACAYPSHSFAKYFVVMIGYFVEMIGYVDPLIPADKD